MALYHGGDRRTHKFSQEKRLTQGQETGVKDGGQRHGQKVKQMDMARVEAELRAKAAEARNAPSDRSLPDPGSAEEVGESSIAASFEPHCRAAPPSLFVVPALSLGRCTVCIVFSVGSLSRPLSA